MSDPQNDSVDSEIIEQPVIETNDSVPHSEGGEQVQAESEVQVDEVEVAKQKANEAFNKQYGEKKQLERELEAERARVAEFESKQREQMAAQVGNIPPVPDSFDFDDDAQYQAAIKKRDEAIQAQANFNAQQNIYTQQQQFQQQQAAQAKQAKLEKLANDFTGNAKKIGATDEELNSVISSLNNSGMTSDLGQAIMSDPDGYLIAKHLAANPMEASEIINANPYIVGAKFADIKAKASALKPKTSSTPSPATNLQGNGVDPDLGRYKIIDGATFE